MKRLQKKRTSGIKGKLLILHDTTEYSYKRKIPSKIGHIREIIFNYGRKYTVYGLLMHSNIVITPEGLPIRLSSIKLWLRVLLFEFYSKLCSPILPPFKK
ncbi:hypothetical protein HOH45_05465 [bacterium]|nr:hypothetical protein [bacterium]